MSGDGIGKQIGLREKDIGISICRKTLHYCRKTLHFYERLHKLSKKPVAHHELHYMLEHSDYSRVVICQKIGISRKTIYDWEYQLVRVKPGMLDKVAKASGIPLDRIPANVREKAVKAFIDAYHTKTEQKPAQKRKEEPHQPKSDYAAQGKAEQERKARQEAKANDPKRHRIRNYGVPTAANQNPHTFSRIHDGHRPKLSKGIDLPSDVEYPDMVAAALKGLAYYEAAYVGYHTVPDATGPSVGNTPHVCGICAGFYWNRPNGSYSQAETIDKANAMISKQIAEDEATTADLI